MTRRAQVGVLPLLAAAMMIHLAPAADAVAMTHAVAVSRAAAATDTRKGEHATKDATRPLVVGSKAFTESVILGELATQSLRAAGQPSEHRRSLGGSRILWDALRGGDVDVYPEYTGTITRELLTQLPLPDDTALRAALAARGLRMSRPLGFSNTYVLGVPRALAQRLDLRTIGDLRDHPALRLGFSNEFLQRGDGWPGLRARYRLPQRSVRGMEHALAYRALAAGAIDVTDLYSTDPEIAQYDLVVLRDDAGYFPDYRAVLLWRAAVDARVAPALARLEGRLDTAAMAGLNARATLGREAETAIAASVLDAVAQGSAGSGGAGRAAGRGAGNDTLHAADQPFWRYTRQHLALTGLSLGAAILLGLPLGIAAALRPRLGRAVLAITGLVQTIPALALLVFMIPLLGIGFAPACVALLAYSLLPIVRNTCAGLSDIPRPLRESAIALGLPRLARLRRVELPLASRSILAGIKTAAVINVGTATLGALIGAGGYGEPIVTGIRLNDVGLILQGAVPAALLALGAQLLFDGIERLVLPRGLRDAPAR